MDTSGSKNYNYLIESFGEEKLRDRYELLLAKSETLINSFCDSLDTELKKCFYINELIVQDIIINYFADIDRLKKFHGIDKVNSIKIAAYTAYWFSKLRPIQIIKSGIVDLEEKL
jgi:hypothetical protein